MGKWKREGKERKKGKKDGWMQSHPLARSHIALLEVLETPELGFGFKNGNRTQPAVSIQQKGSQPGAFNAWHRLSKCFIRLLWMQPESWEETSEISTVHLSLLPQTQS